MTEKGFDLLGVDGLFAMKSIVVYDRVKSRDIYDLIVWPGTMGTPWTMLLRLLQLCSQSGTETPNI